MADEFKAIVQIGYDSSDIEKIKKAIQDIGKDVKINVDINGADIDKKVGSVSKKVKDSVEKNSKGINLFDGSAVAKNIEDIKNLFISLKDPINQISATLTSLKDAADFTKLITGLNTVSHTSLMLQDNLDELKATLDGLGKGGNSSFKLDFKIGGGSVASNAKFGQEARNIAIPELTRMANEIKEYMVSALNSQLKDLGRPLLKDFYDFLGVSRNFGKLYGNKDIEDLASGMLLDKGGLVVKNNVTQTLDNYQQYIEKLQTLAKGVGIDLSPLTSQFSRTASQIVEDTQKIRTGEADVAEQTERLKNIFGGLDDTKFASLSEQLQNILTSLDSISGKLDTLPQILDAFGNIQNVIQFSNVITQIKDGISTMDPTKLAEASQSIGNISSELSTLDTGLSKVEIGKLAQSLSQWGINDGDIKRITDNLDEFSLKILDVYQTVDRSNGKVSVKIKGIDEAGREITLLAGTVDRVDEETKETIRTIEDISVSIHEKFGTAAKDATKSASELSDAVSKGFATKEFDAQMASISNRFLALIEASPELTESFNSLLAAYEELKSAFESGDVNRIREAYENYQQSLKTTTNLVKENEAVQKVAMRMVKESANEQKAAYDSVKKKVQEINKLLLARARAKNIGDVQQVEELTTRLEDANNEYREMDGLLDKLSPEQLAEINNLLKDGQIAADNFGKRAKDTKSILDRLAAGFKTSFVYSLSNLVTGTAMFNRLKTVIKDAYRNVVEIDSAMTELKKVTDETDASYRRFLSDAGQAAIEIGSTVTDYINATADFARLGFGVADSQELAKTASIYHVVGDEIDNIGDASQSVISTMKAFNIEADQSMSIVDKFNEVGNNFAISSGGIGDALTRSASSLAVANSTLDESIALITAANTVVQNPEMVGTAFKTLSARVRGAKTELEDMGEETDTLASSTSKLRSEIQALTGVDIMVDDDNFKSLYKILQEISYVWDDLTDVSRANVLELLGGKRQANVLGSVLTNFDIAEDALATSMDSAGSALKEHDRWLESIEAKTQQLDAALQTLSKDFINSSFVKGGIDFLVQLTSGIDKLVSAVGGLGSIGVVGSLAGVVATIVQINHVMNDAAKSVKLFGHSFSSLGLSITATAIGAVVTIVSSLIHRARELHQQKLDEYANNVADALEKIEKAESSIDSVVKAYAEYGDMTQLTEEQQKSVASVVDDLSSSFDNQAQAIIGAAKEAGNYARALDEIARREAIEQRRNAREGMHSSYGLLEDSIEQSKFGQLTPSPRVRIELQEAVPAEAYSADYGMFNDASAEAMVAYYDVLLKRKNELIDTNRIESDEYNAISKELDSMSENVENYIKFLYEEAEANYILQNGMPKTVEEYKKMQDAIFEYATDGSGNKLDSVFLGTIGEDLKRLLSEDYSGMFDMSEILPDAKTISDEMAKVFEQAASNLGHSDAQVGHIQAMLNSWFSQLAPDQQKLVYQIAMERPSSLFWDMDKWIEELGKAESSADDASMSASEFYSVISDSSEGSLSNTISNTQEYVEKLNELKDSLAGGLTNQQKTDIILEYPELTPYINDTNKLDKAIDDLIEDSHAGLDSKFQETLDSLGGEATEAGALLKSFWDILKGVREESNNLDIEAERTRYSNVQSAYESGQKVGGMNTDEINKVAAAFRDLEGYNPDVLFERTTHGVQLNTIALRTLNKEYEIATKSRYREHLNELVQSYNSLARQLMETTDAQERENISARMKDIQEEANSVADEAAQYDGLTAAYKRWQEASSVTDSRAEWENMGKGLENVKELVSAGWVNDNEVISFMNMFLEDGEKITSWAEAQEGTWSAVQTTIGRYFDGTTGSLQQFLTDASSVEGELFSIQQMADGSWDFDFEFGGEAELATVLSDMYGVQLSAESVQYILEALSDSNFEVHIETDVDQPTQAIADVEQQIQNLQALTERDWKGKKQDAILGIDTEGAISELETAIADATTTTEESDIELPVVVDDEDLQDFLNGRYNDFKATVEDPMYLNLEDTEAQSSLDQFKIVWDSLHDKTVHLSVARNEISAESYASGTAFSQGNWGTRDSGVALVGELGTELLVRNGKYYTIGDNGAEFIKYQKGDIVFNAMQTAELFKYGGTRGRGIAFASGTAFDGGSKGHGDLGPGSPTNPTTPSNPVDPGDLDEVTESAEEATEAVEELKEVFDWIQVKIKRIEREITNLGRTAESVFKSWSTRNNALSEELEKVTEEIEVQQQGVERYRQEAENVGLDEEWAQKVRDGLIDIERLQSEATEESKEETQALIDKIQEYQKWYELMLDCEDAVEELKEQQAELIKQRFDNVTNMYDQYFSTMDTGRSLIENGMKRTEAMGYTLSPEYYKALIRNEKSNMKLLKKERKKLVKELDEAMQSGSIEEGSEAWFEMAQKIDQCTLAIEEADTAIVEYRAQIQQLKWDAFDEALKRIQEINTESSYMIDLMSKYNQYTESGQLSDQGMATMALHAVEHNVYMKQSAALADEIKKLNKEIADDPANQKLIDRRSELLKLQQDAILGAESEKKAIKDMVAEGIQIELDNLQKLIDNYTTLLDKQKD